MPGIVTHIVLFKYKDEVSHTERHLLASKFLALLDTCRLADGPYILSVTGGKNNSPEGADKGLQHAFVVTFATIAHRDYYLSEDPVHQTFKVEVGPKIEDLCVMDFEAGVF